MEYGESGLNTNRRTFLSTLGAGGLMAALGGCQTQTKTTAIRNAAFAATDQYTPTAGTGVRPTRGTETALAAYRRVPGLVAQEQTFNVVGTRRRASTWPMVPRGGPDPSTWRYDHGGPQQLIQSIRLGFLEQPPNVVPVLKAIPSIQSSSRDETFRIGVKLATQPVDEWLMTFGAAPDADSHTLYDEVYLHEQPYGSSGRGIDALTNPTIEVHAAIDDNPTAGFVFADSMLALEWEVV